MSAEKLATHFRRNCPPLYDGSMYGDSSADEEYALDRAAFDRFCAWLEENGKLRPRSLSILARNAFVSSLSVGDCGGEELERRCQRMAQRCAQFQEYLGKTHFADLLKVQ